MIFNSKENIRMAFLGDIFLGGEYIPYAERNGVNIISVFEKVLPITEKADILVLNLEGPVFKGSNTRRGATAILSNHVEVLNFISPHKDCVVNLANNHIMDYGNDGLQETLDILKKNNIKYLGAGKNSSDANRELVLTVRGKNIAFIGCTSNEARVGAIIAGENSYGCASYDNLDSFLSRIRALKDRVDTICVLLHWGHEYFQYPDPKQVNIAHSLVNAGADFVIGHHPHVIQGYEIYKKAFIIYSLGNFFFPEFKSQTGRIKYPKKITKEFMILYLGLSESGDIEHDFIGGFRDDKYKLNIYQSADREAFIRRVEEISCPLGNSHYKAFWAEYNEKRGKELNKEEALEAFYKLRKTPISNLVREIKLKDVTRNIGRLMRYWK